MMEAAKKSWVSPKLEVLDIEETMGGSIGPAPEGQVFTIPVPGYGVVS
jgi:hypothetical protein